MSARSTVRTRRSAIVRVPLGLIGVVATIVLGTTTALGGGFLTAGDGSDDKKAEEKPTWAVPAARMPVEGEGTEAVEAELHNAELRVKEAMQNAETAAYQLKRARTRNYPRGQALEDLKVQAQETHRERTAAASEFSSVVERARREGVPMGTLSPYMDLDERLRTERETWKDDS